MSRPPTFDRQEKLEEAMDLFWEQGYEATSVQDLVDRLALNRSSLYNSFDGKHDLYLEALDHYREVERETLRRHLQEAPTALDGIRRAFLTVADQATESCCGCFTTNATVECASHDPSTRKRACDTFTNKRTLFQNAVERAQTEGAIDPSRNAEALARYLTNALYGIHLTAKTEPAPDVVEDIVKESLRGLTCDPEAASPT